MDSKVGVLKNGPSYTLSYQKFQVCLSSHRKWLFLSLSHISSHFLPSIFSFSLFLALEKPQPSIIKYLLLKHPLIPPKNPHKGPLSFARKPHSCKLREENVRRRQSPDGAFPWSPLPLLSSLSLPLHCHSSSSLANPKSKRTPFLYFPSLSLSLINLHLPLPFPSSPFQGYSAVMLPIFSQFPHYEEALVLALSL